MGLRTGSRWQLADSTTGRIALSQTFDELETTDPEFIRARVGGTEGIIDGRSLRVVIPIRFPRSALGYEMYSTEVGWFRTGGDLRRGVTGVRCEGGKHGVIGSATDGLVAPCEFDRILADCCFSAGVQRVDGMGAAEADAMRRGRIVALYTVSGGKVVGYVDDAQTFHRLPQEPRRSRGGR
jgi:hypothetical protein